MNYLEEWQNENLGWMRKKTVMLGCLSERMAAKWFFLHERERHIRDIEDINRDLEKLKDIELPDEFLALINERFEV